VPAPASRQRSADRWLELKGIHRHNLQGVDAQVPLGVLTAVTGISGSGKSSLMAQALPELMLLHLGHEPVDDSAEQREDGPTVIEATRGQLAGDVDAIQRVVQVDQKPIGRTPRSNLATYTGLFDHVRKLFAATPTRDAAASTPVASRSTWPRAGARPAKARVSSASNCCSCPASMRHARLPWRPLQRGHAEGAVERPQHRRGPADDGRPGAGILRR
jgi:hypothetical protein